MSPSTDPVPTSEKRVSVEMESPGAPTADSASANVAVTADSVTSAASGATRASLGERLKSSALKTRFVGGRLLYWAPVLIALTLFGQFGFLGLRKAVSETRRLDSAEIQLEARHERAESLSRALETELTARADPIYRERQRRFHLTKRDDAANANATSAASGSIVDAASTPTDESTPAAR